MPSSASCARVRRRSRGDDGDLDAGVDGAGVEAFVERHQAHAGLLRRRPGWLAPPAPRRASAATARNAGSPSARCASTAARMRVPKATTTPSSTPASIDVGDSARDAVARARARTSSPASLERAAPAATRSGAVTTSATSWPASWNAAGSRPRPQACRGRRASSRARPKGAGQASMPALGGVDKARARSTRMACLRWSFSRRSRSRMPSRWSSSCWRTLPSSSSPSIEISFPLRSDPRDGPPSAARSASADREPTSSPPRTPIHHGTRRSPG